jgi:hypothetical protein
MLIAYPKIITKANFKELLIFVNLKVSCHTGDLVLLLQQDRQNTEEVPASM